VPMNQGRVLDVTQASGTDANFYDAPMGRQLEQIMSELHGRYYTWAYRKKLFWGSSASAGAAIPAAGATAVTGHILWNKSSLINVVPVAALFGWVATTEAPGNLQYSFLSGAGLAIGTAAPISAFGAVTPQNAFLGGPSPLASFGTTATLTNAGTLLGTLGLSALTTTGTATFGSFQKVFLFDGTLIVPQGVALYPTASAATASTYTQTLIWYEAPV
jgi:hypothetical protein